MVSFQSREDVPVAHFKDAKTRGKVSFLIASIASALCVIPTAAYGSAPGSAYQLTVVAGIPGVANGTMGNVDMPNPDAVAVDSAGNTYVADRNEYVEKVTPSGTLTIVAGNGDVGGQPVPGPATSSPLAPSGIAVDMAGNLYITDAHGYVVKVSTSGSLTIVGGNASQNSGLNPGEPATSSSLEPGAIAVDANGNIYVGDASANVLKIAPDDTLSIPVGYLAGGSASWPSVGVNGYIGLDGVAVDSSGDLFISSASYVFEFTPAGKLSIVAGNGGTYGYGPANWPPLSPAPATSGPLTPTGVAVDSAGNVYVTNGVAISYESPEQPGGTVLKISPGGSMVVIAGLGDGTPARLQRNLIPTGVAIKSDGDVLVADGQGYIDDITPVGGFSRPIGNTQSSRPAAGPATQSPMQPNAVAYDTSGYLYIADDNGYVDKVSTSGSLSVIAGNGDTSSAPLPGNALASPLHPGAITVDRSGNAYVTDRPRGLVLKITPAGALSVFASGSDVGDPVALASDTSGNVYIADHNGYIHKITPSGIASIVAGHGNDTVNNPSTGPATSVGMVPTGVAVDGLGDIYISDYLDYVDKVTPDGNLTHYAGGGSSPAGSVPRAALSTQIAPGPIAVDGAGDLFIDDTLPDVYAGRTSTGTYLEEVTPDGTLTLVAGNGDIASEPVAGWATSSPLQPSGIAISSTGAIAVSNWARGYVASLTRHPTTAPSAPTNVSAHARSSAALVTFTPSLDTGGSVVTGYTVSDGVGQTCSPSSLTTYGNGDMSCTVSGLTPGASYSFVVTATNGVGTSPPSAPSNSVTPYTTPSAPMQVAAVAGASSAAVTWTAPASDGWAPVTGYSVEATDSATPNSSFTVCPSSRTSSANSCTATGLANGHSYTFTVAAWNAAGTGPNSAPSAAVTPLAPPGAPNISYLVAGDSSVTPYWYAPDDGGTPITGYVATAEPGGATCSTTGGQSPNSCSITGLNNGDTYTVTVTATNAVGTSPSGGPASATPRGTIIGTAPPTVSGTVRVGAPLKASTGTWNVTGLSFAYTWLANGNAISGATSATFTPSAAQYGKRLSVEVTASKPDYNSSSARSAATIPVGLGVITNHTLPKIWGTLRPGYTLRTTAGTWSPTGLTIHYQWLVNGRPISGATHSYYRLTAADRGKRMRVRVTVSRLDYASTYRYSAATAYVG